MGLAFPPQIPDPWSLPNLYDSITVAAVPWGTGTPMGGGVRVRGAMRYYKIDQKDAKGQDGATQTYVGTHPKPFKIIFRIWTSAQWAYFNTSLLPLFYYSGVVGKVIPLPIIHPATAIVGISSILTGEIGPYEFNEETKEMLFPIEVREYLPALPGSASVTPIGPSAPSGPTIPGLTVSPLVALKIAQVATLNALVNGPSNFPSNQ